MEDSKDKYVTQEETGELAPVDEVEGRVEAEMKRIEGAREAVAQGTQNPGARARRARAARRGRARAEEKEQ